MRAPSGGWHPLEVRILRGDEVRAEAVIEHVGIGEVFVVAGQSNSANHGEEKQRTQTGRVATFDGQRWQLANDPQPGASGQGGSFLPPFGDAIAQRFNVPVGFIACGIGATSVREWLPRDTLFPNPPTRIDRVRLFPSGGWKSKGEAFEIFWRRMKAMGPNGFRAMLWHQGESDANQRNPARTLPGDLYREYLEKIIRESRREIGWEAPWFVAQVSYHGPDDESSPDIRAAQASLWKDGIANEGPDTDAIKGEFREKGGRGIHFSGAGLREHAARWMDKVAPWLERQIGALPDAAPILDLDADRGVTLVDGDRVSRWQNQVSGFAARDFIQRDEGRLEPGLGRPTLRKAITELNGHSALVFRQQELVCMDEDSFDALTQGHGCTWVAVLAAHEQRVGLEDVNSFFGNLRNGGNYEGLWGCLR
ncbi:MAG: sialate O-acetylesterase, partial [Chthoniobacteraceae bacterium]